MKNLSYLLGALIGCILSHMSIAQDVSGFWLGVTYPTDPSQEVYNYTMSITQNGQVIGGTAQTANPNLPFGGVTKLTGQINNTRFQFQESDANGRTDTRGVCYWKGVITYNPVEESLTGTYQTIPNPNTLKCAADPGGKVELYRIVLKSGNTYCKGAPINLLVTGKNIRWYDSEKKTNLLATGNRFNPKIDQTTIFYITQTLYQMESPAVPIKVTVSGTEITDIKRANPGCATSDGTLTATASGNGNLQYSLNGGAFQTSPTFTGLGAGTYRITVKDSGGCQVEDTTSLSAASAPIISDIRAQPPRCGATDGSLTITASGRNGSLSYSTDGINYQPDPRFTQLTGGTYTVRVRDAQGCENSRSVSLTQSTSMAIGQVDVKPTTCGNPNGSLTVSVLGGSQPVEYSVDGNTYRPDNRLTGMVAGEYIVQVRDAAGCTATRTVLIPASERVRVTDTQITPETCGQQNGQLIIAGVSGEAPFQCALNSEPMATNNTFTNLSAGEYQLTVQDAQGCSFTQTITVPTSCGSVVYVPKAFSPNADATNDALSVFFSFPTLEINRVTIYNRWGSAVFSNEKLNVRSGEAIWDGKINNQDGPSGTYLCIIELRFPNGTQHTHRQAVELIH